MIDMPVIAWHLDAPLLRSAIRYTSAETGFNERLIEKDYFCSVLLADLKSSGEPGLAFKGGTCLSKVHGSFFRLSEDLDFCFAMPVDASRSQRSARVAAVKRHLASFAKRHPGAVRVSEPLRGFNNSTQYAARVEYPSVVTGEHEAIKIEISVREPIVERLKSYSVQALLRDPFRQTTAVAGFEVPTLSCREAYAEKLRAALTRREPAIRDFFDLDHAFNTAIVDLEDRALIRLLRAKLSVPSHAHVDLSSTRIQQLRLQVETQLRPVLRPADLLRFDLDRVLAQVASIAKKVAAS